MNNYYFYNNTLDKKSQYIFENGNVYFKEFNTLTDREKIGIFEKIIDCNNNWDSNDIIIASSNRNFEELVYQYGALIIEEEKKIFENKDNEKKSNCTDVFYKNLYNSLN